MLKSQRFILELDSLLRSVIQGNLSLFSDVIVQDGGYGEFMVLELLKEIGIHLCYIGFDSQCQTSDNLIDFSLSVGTINEYVYAVWF